MNLLKVLTLRLSLINAIVIAFWAGLFYFAVIDEINDEVDDALEDQAEMLIRRSLAGEPLPDSSNGTNSQYYIHRVTKEYAASRSHIRYEDNNVYIKEKREYEPARTISYIYNDDDGGFMEVVVFTPTIDKADLKAALAYWLMALYLILLLCIILVNLRTIKKSMKPLKALLVWLDRYKLGDKNPKLGMETKITEFKKLGDTVQRNMERNEKVYEQQKRFIANASHEMQTPLAIIQNRLEMLLEEANLNEQQMGDVVKTLHTLKSMSRTNRSLLLLCKIDNGQITDTTNVSMGKTAARQLNDLETIYAHRGIKTETDTATDLNVEMNEALATTLVNNLLKNAFTHTPDGGTVRVSTDSLTLRITNSAENGPLDESKIFERFYHTPGRQSSTGLGLSIVKAICNLYGMTISYRFNDDMHVFEVKAKQQ